MTRPPTLLLASLVVAAFAGCGDDTHEQEAGASATATPEDTGGEQGTGCEPVEKPAPREVDLPRPKARLDPATT
jgi:ABC-type Fe3+-hydroxamate transport system substrate-binding protein